MKGGGGQKCKRSEYKNCPHRGWGVKKWHNSVQLVVECPLSRISSRFGFQVGYSNHIYFLPLTKMMNRAAKNWAYFQKIKYSTNQSFQTISQVLVDLQSNIIQSKCFLERFDQFSTLKNYFEIQNFDIFDTIVHNFGKSDDDMIK